MLSLENDRQEVLKNFRLFDSNIFVKQEIDLFSMIVTTSILSNNALFFSSDFINEGIESGITKSGFISTLKDRVKTKSRFQFTFILIKIP